MIFRIEIPIYRQAVVFIFGHDREQAEQWLTANGYRGERYIDDEMMSWAFEDSHSGITGHKEEGHRILIHIDSAGNHRSIAHEIYHAVNKTLEWCGMYPNAANEEAYAYLIGFLTEQVYIKIQEHGNK